MADTTGIPVHVLDRLKTAPYGAYGIDLNQTIVFWNARAEEILGHKASQVLGRKCYEAVQVIDLDGKTTVCTRNCPAIIAANSGYIPPVAYVQMVSASGVRKPVTMFPLIVNSRDERPLLIHMFHETPAGEPDSDKPMPLPLTSRETEVLSKLALGMRPVEIADQLFISVHTVRKHISNACKKLHAHGMMSTVLAARSRHLI